LIEVRFFLSQHLYNFVVFSPFSYFAKTGSVIVSDSNEHGVFETDITLFITIINGFVVLDVFGLTLSKAVGLVII
tara:strand:+ start:334 stop:558 length:225 start_codon:yes stop_codon:yes gene_type:complete